MSSRAIFSPFHYIDRFDPHLAFAAGWSRLDSCGISAKYHAGFNRYE